MHHCISLIGINGTIISGYGAPGIAANLLLTEISSCFLSIKSLTPKFEHDKPWFHANLITFFVTFTMFRIVLMPFMLLNAATELTHYFEQRTVFENFCCLCCIAMMTALAAVNIYWYRLIVKKLY